MGTCPSKSEYAAELALVSDKPGFLRRHSGLPGPRGNLELVQAAADVGEEADFREWISLGAPRAASDVDPTDEFLAVCGVVGLGRLTAEGRMDLARELRGHAEDERWRVREGVAMALQRVGDADVSRLFALVSGWVDGPPYVQRAVVAGVAEPRLLKTADAAAQGSGDGRPGHDAVRGLGRSPDGGIAHASPSARILLERGGRGGPGAGESPLGALGRVPRPGHPLDGQREPEEGPAGPARPRVDGRDDRAARRNPGS